MAAPYGILYITVTLINIIYLNVCIPFLFLFCFGRLELFPALLVPSIALPYPTSIVLKDSVE